MVAKEMLSWAFVCTCAECSPVQFILVLKEVQMEESDTRSPKRCAADLENAYRLEMKP